jgi:hypothetical protein
MDLDYGLWTYDRRKLWTPNVVVSVCCCLLFLSEKIFWYLKIDYGHLAKSIDFVMAFGRQN